jgi:hypothetical protein
VDNLMHILRRLPTLETLVMTGTPLDNVIGVANAADVQAARPGERDSLQYRRTIIGLIDIP